MSVATTTLETTASSTNYACEICALRFDRKKQLTEHLAGKRHREAVAAASEHWAAFQRGSWQEPSLTLEEQEAIVTRAWSLAEFVVDLPSRSRSEGSGIAPHVTLSSLAPQRRLMLWRYLRELMPSRPLLPEVFAELERNHGRYARVKELLESTMVFQHVEQAILRSDPSTVLKRGKVHVTAGRSYLPRTRKLLDVACGHGLVGLLVAYRFPQVEVLGIDRTQRPAYSAFVDAWRTAHLASQSGAAAADRAGGASASAPLATTLGASVSDASSSMPGAEVDGAPLSNIRFVEGEFADLAEDEGAGAGEDGGFVDERTLVLCVHGCNEVNVEAATMAKRTGASWLLVPCCLRTDLYLDVDSIRLPDESHYAFLCGSMATQYGASRVATVDARVTPRSIVLSGGEAPSPSREAVAAAAARLTAHGKVSSLRPARGGGAHAHRPGQHQLPVPGAGRPK